MQEAVDVDKDIDESQRSGSWVDGNLSTRFACSQSLLFGDVLVVGRDHSRANRVLDIVYLPCLVCMGETALYLEGTMLTRFGNTADQPHYRIKKRACRDEKGSWRREGCEEAVGRSGPTVR